MRPPSEQEDLLRDTENAIAEMERAIRAHPKVESLRVSLRSLLKRKVMLQAKIRDLREAFHRRRTQ